MGQILRVALNGKPVEIDDLPATTTLLDWLRMHAGQCGTKEGCAEGDCGACTVVLERLGAEGVLSSPVNACLTMLGQADGLGVRTIEGLTAPDGTLHPIQSALAEGGGTQCGFCTPGFVMAAYGFFSTRQGERDLASIHDALAGNLCRCTGYRPIVEGMQKVACETHGSINENQELISTLRTVGRTESVSFEHEEQRFFAPRSLTEALELRARFPQATILAGGTDLGLLVSQRRESIPLIIHVGNVPDLQRLEDAGADLMVGSAVTYADALEALTHAYPTLHSYLTRLGSPQIRNMGTIGGNIGTASPIGDALPILLALAGRVKVRSAARGAREILAEQFFTGYRQTALGPGELIEAVLIPKPSPGALIFVDKISKRRDQDISTVCGAYRLDLDGGIVRQARLAFGGMAATPKRAHHAEIVLIGRRLDLDAVVGAGEALEKDFQPLSDWRGSAEYRLAVAKNLLRRLYWRIVQPSTPIEIDIL